MEGHTQGSGSHCQSLLQIFKCVDHDVQKIEMYFFVEV